MQLNTSYGTVIDGITTIIGVSFDALIYPVTQIGGGQPVREPISGFWSNLGYYALGVGSTYTDANGGVWNVNKTGNITGLAPIAGIAPTPGKIRNLKILPSLDITGKLHGTLPRIQDLAKYSKDELILLREELLKSVQQRIKVTSRMGRDRAHGQRQGAEQNLIKSIEKRLQSTP